MMSERGIDPELAADINPNVVSLGYNPSSWKQRVPICVMAGVAAVIASYLAMYQWRLVATPWDPIFGDQTRSVLDSTVSHRMVEWFRIPDAAFGVLAYLGDALFGLAGSTRRWQYRPWMVILFGIDVIPLGIVSVVLVVLQGTVVGSWCFLCLVTAAISLVLVYWAYDEVWLSLRYLAGIRRETRSWLAVWNAVWGRPSLAGERVAQRLIREV